MQAEQMPMKERLLNILDNLRDDEVNLEETPVIFKWSYEEEPHIQFQLMIKETEQGNLPLGSETVH